MEIRDYWRQISEENIDHWWPVVRQWGYPRELTPNDRAGAWFCYAGGRLLVWYTAGPEDDTLCVHAVCSPKLERRIMGTPAVMQRLELTAEILGATRLYAYLPEDSQVPSRLMRRYLRMRGWQQNKFGSYRDLGEVNHGRLSKRHCSGAELDQEIADTG